MLRFNILNMFIFHLGCLISMDRKLLYYKTHIQNGCLRGDSTCFIMTGFKYNDYN